MRWRTFWISTASKSQTTPPQTERAKRSVSCHQRQRSHLHTAVHALWMPPKVGLFSECSSRVAWRTALCKLHIWYILHLFILFYRYAFPSLISCLIRIDGFLLEKQFRKFWASPPSWPCVSWGGVCLRTRVCVGHMAVTFVSIKITKIRIMRIQYLKLFFSLYLRMYNWLPYISVSLHLPRGGKKIPEIYVQT